MNRCDDGTNDTEDQSRCDIQSLSSKCLRIWRKENSADALTNEITKDEKTALCQLLSTDVFNFNRRPNGTYMDVKVKTEHVRLIW